MHFSLTNHSLIVMFEPTIEVRTYCSDLSWELNCKVSFFPVFSTSQEAENFQKNSREFFLSEIILLFFLIFTSGFKVIFTLSTCPIKVANFDVTIEKCDYELWQYNLIVTQKAVGFGLLKCGHYGHGNSDFSGLVGAYIDPYFFAEKFRGRIL